MAWVVVDAPKVDAANVPDTLVAVTAPLSYVRFHGRNARTWNVRGGSAAQRFDYLYEEGELRRVSRELAAKGAALGDLTVLRVTGEHVSAVASATALAERATTESPDLILAGATPGGRDVAAIPVDVPPHGLGPCADL